MSKFHKDILEKPWNAIVLVIFTFFLSVFISSRRSSLISLITPYEFYLLLSFLIMMGIYAFYSFYVIPTVFQLPNGRQKFSEYIKTLKLSKTGLSMKSIFLSLLIGVIGLMVSIAIGFFLSYFNMLSTDFIQIFKLPKLTIRYSFIFINNIVPALWEEIIFRGVILTLLLKIYSTRKAIIIDGLIFGIFHLSNILGGANLFSTIGQVIFASFFGVSLAYLYIKTDNLIPSIFAHYIHNILQVFVSITTPPRFFFFYIALISVFPMVLSIIIIYFIGREQEPF